MNVNRLINDFKRQTKSTIWKHMDAMAVNYAVYSNRLKGFEPYFYNNDVYIYADSTNLVIVAIDCSDKGEKQTYEESEGIDMLIYRPGTQPHESAVWKMKETVEVIKNRLKLHDVYVEVYGILITEATITNAEDLEDIYPRLDAARHPVTEHRH